jgi:hypothetical protein
MLKSLCQVWPIVEKGSHTVKYFKTDPDKYRRPSDKFTMNTLSQKTTACFTRFGRPALVIILVYSILRGLRFPNKWSTTHLLFNYDQGFVKRGLIGSLINKINVEVFYSYDFAFALGMLILIINCRLLYLLAKEFMASSNMVVCLVPFVYFSSLAPVFLSHTPVYAEHFGLAIVLVAFRIRKPLPRIAFALISFTVIILVHEAMFLIFFPPVLISILLDQEVKKDRLTLSATAICSVLLGALFLIVGNATISENSARIMHGDLQALADYKLRSEAFEVLFRDMKWTLSNMIGFWSIDGIFIELLNSLAVTLPVVVLFTFLSRKLLVTIRAHPAFIALAVLSSLSPLILHLVSYDMHRWNTLAITSAFLTLFAVYRNCPGELSDLSISSEVMVHLMMAAIILGAVSTIGLFDGYYVRSFPFAELQIYVYKLLHGMESFPAIPAY